MRCCRLPAVLTFCGALSSCVVVPRTTEVYDAGCQVVTRRVVLEVQQVAAVTGCRNNVECTTVLVTAGVITAATAVVSGSLAVVGNVVYWVEKQGRCLRAPPAPSASAPALTT